MVDPQRPMDAYREFIDPTDIRKSFALPRVDDFYKMRDQHKTLEWPPKFPQHANYSSNGHFNSWGGLFNKEPMTKHVMTMDDMDSDKESEASGSSSGSAKSNAKSMLRGPRIHHIPILVEGRDDSSGYSSDTPPDETKPPLVTQKRNTSSHHLHSSSQPTQNGYNRTPTHGVSHYKTPQAPAQRSKSDQEFSPRTEDPSHNQHRKSASQPPLSPPVKVPPQTGQHVSRVDVNKSSPPVENENQTSNNQKRREPDPREQIQKILQEMQEFKKRVDLFSGSYKDKDYRYLDEMLTRLMLKLDNVNTEGQDGIRQERRRAVKEIQSCILELENRVLKNQEALRNQATQGGPPSSNDPSRDNEHANSNNSEDPMDVSDL